MKKNFFYSGHTFLQANSSIPAGFIFSALVHVLSSRTVKRCWKIVALNRADFRLREQIVMAQQAHLREDFSGLFYPSCSFLIIIPCIFQKNREKCLLKQVNYARSLSLSIISKAAFRFSSFSPLCYIKPPHSPDRCFKPSPTKVTQTRYLRTRKEGKKEIRRK